MSVLRHERSCIVCGTKYSYCPVCSEYDHLPQWMIGVESENCNNINDVISKYHGKAIDKKEAKELLSKLDLSKKDNYNDFLKNMVEEIMSEDDKEMIEEVKEEMSDFDVLSSSIDKAQEEIKVNNSYKPNYNKHKK